MINIDGYDVIRKGAGMVGCLFDISAILKSDVTLYHPTLEICLEICKPHSQPFMLVKIYRPPDAPHDFFIHFEN